MAECISCGKTIGFFENKNGYCSVCFDEFLNRTPAERAELLNKTPAEFAAHRAKKVEQKEGRDKAINAIMLTTETTPNLNITRRIEIVTAECAFGMHIFKDLFAGVRDIVGGRSEAVQATMRDSRRTVLYELKKEAHAVGANAVVGVDLDYVELSKAGNMVLLVASGTAVVIEEGPT